MRQITIRVAPQYGNTQEISANKVQGGLAIHRMFYPNRFINPKKQGSYTITHLASGLSIYGKHLSFKEALTLLSYLLKVEIDWNKGEAYILENQEKVKEAILSFEDKHLYRIVGGKV